MFRFAIPKAVSGRPCTHAMLATRCPLVLGTTFDVRAAASSCVWLVGRLTRVKAARTLLVQKQAIKLLSVATCAPSSSAQLMWGHAASAAMPAVAYYAPHAICLGAPSSFHQNSMSQVPPVQVMQGLVGTPEDAVAVLRGLGLQLVPHKAELSGRAGAPSADTLRTSPQSRDATWGSVSHPSAGPITYLSAAAVSLAESGLSQMRSQLTRGVQGDRQLQFSFLQAAGQAPHEVASLRDGISTGSEFHQNSTLPPTMLCKGGLTILSES